VKIKSGEIEIVMGSSHSGRSVLLGNDDAGNQTQHTPGPWKVDNSKALIMDSNGKPLALLQWPSEDRSEEETLANAKLMAKAPELLAEYERLREILNGPTRVSYSRAEMDAKLKAWMIEQFGHPKEYRSEPDLKEQWYRDYGMMYHFICDNYPVAGESEGGGS
jgi:hypothetical protein